MRSNYKKLGPYIREVDIRNTEDKRDNLLGVSTQKVFIESIANTVGTDFKKYRVVKRKQFTYVPDTSRRGDKIGIAMLDTYDEGLVSQAYTVFEVIDHDELDPEYLMMWFRRPEFDRYARYMSHGSVREIFGWEEMCDVELPIPHIDIQREIVREYNTVVDRIRLNEEIIQRLEETAQAIYKHWFVDFEFPISKEYAESISKPELEGMPYQSSGGEMVYCGELDKEIPLGWADESLEHLIDFANGKGYVSKTGHYPIYGGNGILGYSEDWNRENIIVIGRVGQYCGSLYWVSGKCWVSDNAIGATPKDGASMFYFYMLKDLSLNERAEGTGQPLITQNLLNNIRVIKPETRLVGIFENIAQSTVHYFQTIEQELEQLHKFTDIQIASIAQLREVES